MEPTEEQIEREYAERIAREVLFVERVDDPREVVDEPVDDHMEEWEEESEVEGDGEQGEVEEVEEVVKEMNLIWLLLSGNILLRDGFTKYYGQMVVVAGLFLLSIVVMFWSLHLDMQYSSLMRDVQLLRERSVRLEEVRFDRTSHSSIVKELERRGINIEDPTTPATVIERGLW